MSRRSAFARVPFAGRPVLAVVRVRVAIDLKNSLLAQGWWAQELLQAGELLQGDANRAVVPDDELLPGAGAPPYLTDPGGEDPRQAAVEQAVGLCAYAEPRAHPSEEGREEPGPPLALGVQPRGGGGGHGVGHAVGHGVVETGIGGGTPPHGERRHDRDEQVGRD